MTFPTNHDLIPPPRPAISKGDEEAAKLTANFVNSFAVGVAITGGIAPIFAFLNGSTAPQIEFWQVLGASAVCIAGAVALHFSARRFLKRELTP